MGDSKEERENHLCSPGCQDCRQSIMILQLISLVLFSALFMALLAKVAVPRAQTQRLEQIQQQLTQINASLAGLCRPCPWDWELFQGSCYLFSQTQGTWEASATSCQDLGAHLVIINSVEEQRFMEYWNVRKKQRSWIGLSDHRLEDFWQWVDGTPLQLSFWKEGEPNNDEDEDCVELFPDKWNDNKCTAQNFWVCEQPSAPCPRH